MLPQVRTCLCRENGVAALLLSVFSETLLWRFCVHKPLLQPLSCFQSVPVMLGEAEEEVSLQLADRMRSWLCIQNSLCLVTPGRVSDMQS